ncbi:MAG: cell division protein ZapA [Pseudomonadota bacterium]
MSNEVKPMTVTIFDKEYVVGCPEDEREMLFAAVEYLNAKMAEQRDGGKVIGSERIAVMAALNITSEFLTFRNNNQSSVTELCEGISRISKKIADTLHNDDGIALSSAQPVTE